MAKRTTTPTNATLPVEVIPSDAGRAPQDGIALCLSGGGYRAMIFHVGALWRFNEAGLLPQIDRISSVSGGSITAGVLAMNWAKLGFDPTTKVASGFVAQLVDPVRSLAGKTIDEGSIIGGLLSPFSSIGDKMVAAYRKYLFGETTLQNLPDTPRFVFNATNVQSGALWRFMKPYMRDYRVGEVKNPNVPLAVAVAASAAFPPVLSPVRLELDPDTFTPKSGLDLQREPFTSDVWLSDGGVYDNLGLETAWKRYKTVLVSDGGAKMDAQAEPDSDWARHSMRVLDLIDNQVRSLRKRHLIDSYRSKTRQGAYWGIRTNVADYQLADAMNCPIDQTGALAAVATRLKRVEPALQKRLINWGYAVCDAALRRHVWPNLAKPAGFPYQDVGVG